MLNPNTCIVGVGRLACLTFLFKSNRDVIIIRINFVMTSVFLNFELYDYADKHLLEIDVDKIKT